MGRSDSRRPGAPYLSGEGAQGARIEASRSDFNRDSLGKPGTENRVNEMLSDDDPRKRLWDELVRLRNISDEFLYLYQGPPDRTELLSRTSPWFFSYVGRLMFAQIILLISKLTDPAVMNGHRNLTISVLLDDPNIDRVEGVRDEVEAALLAARALTEPIRVHRHKAIAHLDHDFAIRVRGAELPKLSKALIERCITEMERAYNLVGERIYDTGSSFELAALGDAKSLVIALENAKKWKADELRRMREEHGLPRVDSE
jgi:hypothetical protein